MMLRRMALLALFCGSVIFAQPRRGPTPPPGVKVDRNLYGREPMPQVTAWMPANTPEVRAMVLAFLDQHLKPAK